MKIVLTKTEQRDLQKCQISCTRQQNLQRTMKQRGRRWKSIHYQRQYLDKFAKEHKFKDASGWYGVSTGVLGTSGCSAVKNYYGGSLLRMLQCVVPECQWKAWKFQMVPANYWDSLKNQRECFDYVAKTSLHIQHYEDFYNVTFDQMVSSGIGGLLKGHYEGSPSKLIQSLYVEYNWQTWRFKTVPQSYWLSLQNQRNLLDWIAFDKLGIQNFEEWYSVAHQIRQYENGGGIVSLLFGHYNGSPSQMLQAIYPEYQWIPWRFYRLPSFFWKETKNLRSYFDWILQQNPYLKVADLVDKSARFFGQHLQPLLSMYSRQEAAATAYPEVNWQPKQQTTVHNRRINSHSQVSLLEAIQLLLPKGTTVHHNYIHPLLSFDDSGLNMELDIYSPELNLAFEYQGQHHFENRWQAAAKSSFVQQQDNDNQKIEACTQHNITLISIPFWWDKKLSSLASTIHYHRPDIPIQEYNKDQEVVARQTSPKRHVHQLVV